MIVSIRHKGLRRLWDENDPSRLPQDQVKKIRMILDWLDAAKKITDMDISNLCLHSLKGNLADYWAVTVKANWRIIFQFEDGKAYLVDYLDYH
jgi:toxin HigB-1